LHNRRSDGVSCGSFVATPAFTLEVDRWRYVVANRRIATARWYDWLLIDRADDLDDLAAALAFE
jgi:hypothetical protein